MLPRRLGLKQWEQILLLYYLLSVLWLRPFKSESTFHSKCSLSYKCGPWSFMFSTIYLIISKLYCCWFCFFCPGQQQKSFIIHCFILSSKFWWGKTVAMYSSILSFVKWFCRVFLFFAIDFHVLFCFILMLSCLNFFFLLIRMLERNSVSSHCQNPRIFFKPHKWSLKIFRKISGNWRKT